jgi:hypothetical protein
MEPVPARLAVSEDVEFELAQPTTILLEPPEKRIYVACDHIASVAELVEWTTEAKAGPPENVRGVMVSFSEERKQLEEALARRARIIVYECKGHVVYPPELASYIWYNAIGEIVVASRVRMEAVRLR